MIQPAHKSECVEFKRATLQDSGVVPVTARAEVIREKLRTTRGGEARATAPTVLIVNSSATARIELRGALHAAGFTVTARDSRVSAMMTLRDRRFDLVIVDLVLQDGTGIELVRLLRCMPATATLPVLLLASDSRLDERAQSLELSSDEILQKPFTDAELVKRAQWIVGILSPLESPPSSDRPRGCSPITHHDEQRSSPPEPRDPPANAVWRNRDDVPQGSLLYRAVVGSGIASVIGPTTVARACKRAGVDVGASSPSVLARALPALRDTLRLFLRDEETETRMIKMAKLLQAVA